MNELTKDLGIFLSRDLMYIIGGTSFLLSASFTFGIDYKQILDTMGNLYAGLFLFGVAYCIGYMNQEVMSLTPILTTQPPAGRTNKLLRWLYRRFTKLEWNTAFTPSPLTIVRLKTLYSPDQLRELERVICLKNVGSAVGSNWFISSIILVAYSLMSGTLCLSLLIVSLYIFAASLFLILLAWLRGMQQAVFVKELADKIPVKLLSGQEPPPVVS